MVNVFVILDQYIHGENPWFWYNSDKKYAKNNDEYQVSLFDKSCFLYVFLGDNFIMITN